jgi:glycosyltransferase involved in cell wall biosynthesis
MRILIFTWRDIKHPLAGGSELYFHEFAKRWVSWGHEVIWISGGWKNCGEEEVIDGIKIMRVGGEKSLYFLAPLKYISLKNKPDVIIDNENGIPFFSPFFSRKKKILHIHHVHHDVWEIETKDKSLKERFLGFIGYTLEARIMPLIYKKTPIITLSHSSAKEIKNKISKNIMGLVNPGINFVKYKKYKKNKNPGLLFLNRIKRYKGVETLLRATEILNKKIKNLDVFIAGVGDDLKEMEEFSEKRNFKNVCFLGRISEEKKYELMQKSWIFINPSFKEGWGIVNIEAGYFGLPVIGSRVSGIKDSIIDGKTGLLFEYGNPKDLAEKIIFLINRKNERKVMGNYGKKWAAKFDWDVKAKEYLGLLKKIVGRK